MCCLGVLMTGITRNSKHNHKIVEINEVNSDVSDDIQSLNNVSVEE
jgi:hypothetical protein